MELRKLRKNPVTVSFMINCYLFNILIRDCFTIELRQRENCENQLHKELMKLSWKKFIRHVRDAGHQIFGDKQRKKG